MKTNEKLNKLLSKVQKETVSEEFIYGVTNRAGRGALQRLNDFFVDRSRVSVRDKAYFFELLATLVRAGIPINSALSALSKRTESEKLRRVIATLSFELEHGRRRSAA